MLITFFSQRREEEKGKEGKERRFLFLITLFTYYTVTPHFISYFFINFVTREVLYFLVTHRLSSVYVNLLLGTLKAMLECNVRETFRKSNQSFSSMQTNVCCFLWNRHDIAHRRRNDQMAQSLSWYIDRVRKCTARPSAATSEKSRYYLARAAKQWPRVCLVTNYGIVKRTSVTRYLDKPTRLCLFRKIEFDLGTRLLEVQPRPIRNISCFDSGISQGFACDRNGCQ